MNSCFYFCQCKFFYEYIQGTVMYDNNTKVFTSEYSENFLFVPFVVFKLSSGKPFFTSKKEKRKHFFCAHYFKSKTVMFGSE